VTLTDPGTYFEHFQPGAVHAHRRGRTLTEADNLVWSLRTMNTAQTHFNIEYLKDYLDGAFTEPLVNAAIVVAIVVGLTTADMSQNAYGDFRYDDWAMPSPVFPGDTIYASSEVLTCDPHPQREDLGILRYAITGRNQRDEVVCTITRSVSIKRAAHWQARDGEWDVARDTGTLSTAMEAAE